MPIANAVPSGTAIRTVRIESLKVCTIAWRSAGLVHRESNGSWYHHRIEKPCHVLRERPELNEKMIAITTGRIDQAMYPQVMTFKNRGLPHGLPNHPVAVARCGCRPSAGRVG